MKPVSLLAPTTFSEDVEEKPELSKEAAACDYDISKTTSENPYAI